MGYIAAPLPVATACSILQSNLTSGACTISQRAALAAIEHGKALSVEMVVSLKSRRDFVVSRLQEIPLIEFPFPTGPFSVVLAESRTIKTDVDFNIRLLNGFHCALVPGDSDILEILTSAF